MDRQAVRVEVQQWRRSIERDVASGGTVMHAVEAVRPRMQQRNAGGRACPGGRREIVDAAQELDAARGERRAQHPVSRQKERGQVARDEPMRARIAARIGTARLRR